MDRCVFCLELICKHSNPQAPCASSFAKGAYDVSHSIAISILFR